MTIGSSVQAIALALATASLPTGQVDATATPAPTQGARSLRVAAEPGFGFVANHGQWPDAARFVARRRDMIAHAEASGFWLQFHGRDTERDLVVRSVMRFAFEDLDPEALLRGEGQVAGRYHFLLGNDPEQWRTDVPGFAALRWVGVRPGVDVLLQRGEASALLEYSLACAPGTGSRPLVLRLDGADALEVDSDGGLRARTIGGELRQSPPRAWEIASGGEERSVDVRFALLGDGRFALEVPDRNDALGLRIDPGLEWAGYIGGLYADLPNGLGITDADEPIAVGETMSFDFPTTPGVIQQFDLPMRDGYVMKVSADGTAMVFSTYLGGSGLDEAWGVAVQDGQRPVVVGVTASANFPLTPGAWDLQLDQDEAFVTRLRPDGAGLLSSSYLGGSADDVARAVVIRPDGAIAIAGDTFSSDIPGTSAGAQPTLGGTSGEDVFVAIVNATGSGVLHATYLGGAQEENVYDLAVAQDGSVVIGGQTESRDFPVTPGVFDPIYSPPGSQFGSGFVTKCSSLLDSLTFSTHLDGTFASTIVRGVAISQAGRVAAVGFTQSPDFPTTPGVLQPSLQGSDDGFVTLIEADGKSLVYSTFVGTTHGGSVEDVELVGDVATVAGTTTSPFPTTPGAYDPVKSGTWDAFVMRFQPNGSGLLYGTAMGNPLGVVGSQALRLDSTGRAIVLGHVTNDKFPVTPGSFDSFYGGGKSSGWDEGFLAKLELQPIGVTSIGASTAACKGPIHLTGLGEAKAGNGTFAIACTGAPPGAFGAMAVGTVAAPPGISLLGVTIHLDLTQPYILIPGTADALGYRVFPLPLPLAAEDKIRGVQAVWLDTGGCGGSLTFSASEALKIRVGPP